VVAISAGMYHTCALLINGTLKCWGRNSYGQLGDGTTTDKSTSVSVVNYNFGGRYDKTGGIPYTIQRPPYFSDIYFVRAYADPEPTYSIGSEEVYVAPAISVTFSYTAIDFGAVEPYTIAEKKGIEFNATIEATADYRILASATNWSGVITISAETLYFAVNSTLEDLTFATAKQLFTTPQEIAVFPATVSTNYHAYYFSVPLVPPGTYTAIVTITYEVV